MGSKTALGGGQNRDASMFQPRKRSPQGQVKLLQLLKVHVSVRVKQWRENLPDCFMDILYGAEFSWDVL